MAGQASSVTRCMEAAARGGLCVGHQRPCVSASGVGLERGPPAEGSTIPRTDSALIAKVN